MDGIEWIHARVTYRGREAEVGDIVHSSELCTHRTRATTAWWPATSC